jgi:hypothetical protein
LALWTAGFLLHWVLAAGVKGAIAHLDGPVGAWVSWFLAGGLIAESPPLRRRRV